MWINLINKLFDAFFLNLVSKGDAHKTQITTFRKIAVPFAAEMVKQDRAATIKYVETQIKIMNKKILLQKNEKRTDLLLAKTEALIGVLKFLNENK